MFTHFALILAGSAAIPACWSAQAPGGTLPAPAALATLSSNSLGPRIRFNTENYDAGTNLAGVPIRYTFVVTNTGDDTLEISNAIGSCSCTVVGEGSARNAWSLQKVAPGQTCRIPIEIVTDSLRGQINKTVTVISNDRTRPSMALQINGVIWLPIEVSPQPTVYFTLMPDATNPSTQTLRIFNRMGTPLALSDPQSTTNVFSAMLKTNVPGQEFELAVTAAAPAHLPATLSNTFIQGEISLKSSATNKNPLIIPVFETIAPEITVFPASIQLPAGPLAQPSTSHITIRDNIANLGLSDPAVNFPGVNASVTVMQTNRIYVVSVVFPQGFAAQPGQNVVVTVKTDNPRFPTIAVPVAPVPGMAQPVRPPVAAPPLRTSLLAPAPRATFVAPANVTNTPLSSPNPAGRADSPQP